MIRLITTIVPIIKNNRTFRKIGKRDIIFIKIYPVSAGYHILNIENTQTGQNNLFNGEAMPLEKLRLDKLCVCDIT